MQTDYRTGRPEELLREIGDLEDAYAEALGDGVDARTLSNVWEEIKSLRRNIGERAGGEPIAGFPR